jgi:hypothetical protein
VGAYNQLQPKLLKEAGDIPDTEYEADPPIIILPVHHIVTGISPQQVAQQPLVGPFDGPRQLCDLVQRVERGGDAAVHADDLLVDYCADWQHVENVAEKFPGFYRVATLALIVETVFLVDRGTFVVSSQQEEILGVTDFVGQ